MLNVAHPHQVFYMKYMYVDFGIHVLHVLHVPGTMMVVDFGIHVCRTQEQVHQGYTLKDI